MGWLNAGQRPPKRGWEEKGMSQVKGGSKWVGGGGGGEWRRDGSGIREQKVCMREKGERGRKHLEDGKAVFGIFYTGGS